MNKTLEITLASIIAVLTLAFVGFKLSGNFINQDKYLEELAYAINTNNIDYLLDKTEIEGHDKALSAEDLEGILKVLTEERITAYSLSTSIGNLSENYYLKADGKEKLIYNKYKLVIKPHNIVINSNFDNCKFFLDDSLLGSVGKDVFLIEANNITPGYHTIKIVYEGEYGDITTEEKVVVFSLSDNTLRYHMELESYSTYVYTYMDNAKLYIDNKDSGIMLNEGKDIGPFPMDKDVSLQAKAIINGQTYESEIFRSKDYASQDIFLEIDYTEPEPEPEPEEFHAYVEEAIQQHIWEYQHRLVDAINQGNYSLVSPYIKANSPLESSQMDLVKRLYEKGTTEEFIGYNFYDTYQISPTEFEADVGEQHEIYYDNGNAETVNNRWIYSVTYDGYNIKLTNLRSY